MSKLSAKDYWHRKFGELPATDADKLAVAMMTEFAEAYHAAAMAEVWKEVEECSGANYLDGIMDADIGGPFVAREDVLAILDKHIPKP